MDTARETIESIYGLSPMQQGMLVHSAHDKGSGVYLVQLRLGFTGEVEPKTFEQAWQLAGDRHSALRTSFHWEDIRNPVQVVHRQLPVGIEQMDWRDLTASEQDQRLSDWLRQDRQRGFDLRQAPLWRLTLIRYEDQRYELIWLFHHIILEGWSASIVLNEVFRSYQDLQAGRAVQLPVVRPYQDYIGWLKQQDPTEAETYWRQALDRFTTPTPLTVDHAPHDTDRQESDTAAKKHVLSPEMTAALRRVVQSHKMTLNTLVHGAWALLLARYSGQDDVVYGSVVSGREGDLDGIESMVGLFVNTLPTRVRVNGQDMILDWLKHLQTDQVQMRRYEHTPLIQTQAYSPVPPGQRLFESLLAFENWASSLNLNSSAGGIGIEDVQVFEGGTDYPLVMVVTPGHQLALRCSYDRQRFDGCVIQRLLGHLTTLLEAIAADPNRRVCDLPMVTQDERQRLIHTDPTPKLPTESCLHELFENQVQRSPDSIALTCGNENLTYGQLNRKANQLAHWLRRQGVGPETIVGLCMERSTDMVVGLLGILKAGGAYLPLDSQYPKERLAYMLRDSQAKFVVTQRTFKNHLLSEGCQLVVIDDSLALAQESEQDLESGASPADLAYVIYTSGSTGKPKGVMVNHANVARLFTSTQHWFGFDASDVWTLFHSYAFDFSVWELWGALLHGGRLVVVPYWVSRSPEDFYKLLADERVTVLNQTPSAFQQLIQAEQEMDTSPHLALRWVVFGGEALDPKNLQPWFDRHGDDTPRLVNMYGITETTVHVTFRAMTMQDALDQAGSVIGEPLPDLQIYILDQHQQLAPIGVPGEMVIGGAGVARGYLNRPDLTAQRFIQNPFEDDSKAMFYRSGDLARRLDNGDIEYLGRMDQQVQIRGFRVELGEIESVITEHRDVCQAVVLVSENTFGDKQLTAYVVLTGDPDKALEQVRVTVKERLPDYMMPAVFVVIEAVPLTANGKIDRKALLALVAPRDAADAASYTSPRTPIEEIIAGIWADILQLPRVGIEDNFFELGGQSLLATRVLSKIRDQLQVELSIRDVFEMQTIAELATHIESARRQEKSALLPAIELSPRDRPLPLSYAQQRLWFIDQLDAGAAYNLPWMLRLCGPLDQDALAQSLQTLIDRHEALRTTFRVSSGKPLAVIGTASPTPLAKVDLNHLSAEAREQKLRQLANEEANKTFDLAKGPLLRASLVHLDDQTHALLLNIHHIVSDGWSMGVLTQELATAYQAYSAGTTPQLPDLAVQYADWACWQQQLLDSGTLATQLTYWRNRLADLPALAMPTDRPRPSVQSMHGAKRSVTLPNELVEAVKALSRGQGATLFMTLMTVFKTLLMRYCGQTDIPVGSPISGRTQSQIEGVIGLFVNTLVLRDDLSGNPTFVELLDQVKATALEAYANQDLPFDLLVDELQPQRTLSQAPLAPVLFSLQNAMQTPIHIPGLDLSPIEFDHTTAKFDLCLFVTETDDGLRAAMEYSTDLFDRQTIDRFLSHFQVLLEAIVANPDLRLDQLPLLTEAEQQTLLHDWTATATEYPSDLCVHQLFEQQAQHTPHAVALAFNDQTLTYQSLNEKSNQLAHHLRDCGVGPDTLVAICVDRGFDLVVGLLAILKAGGAYVPLDPEYPTERLALMIQDTQPVVLITHAVMRQQLPDLESLGLKPQVLCLDTDADRFNNRSTDNLDHQTQPDHLAYVTFTSGSTGIPKGVQVPHRGITRLLFGVDYIELGPQHTFLQLAPVSFDASTLEIWGALLHGGKLALFAERVPSIQQLADALKHHQVTTLWLTASLYNTVIDQQPQALAGVQQLLIGGEALSVAHVRRGLEQLPQTQIINGYGPTESTTFTCCYRIPKDPGNLTNVASIPIGKPIGNTQVYVLDPAMNPVPIAVSGELYIGGAGLARGYLNDPELTQQKFIDSPFDSGKLYKTGDLVRWMPNGQIEFLGRIDHQVKIRGFRIELGEIETALTQLPQVQEAAVLCRQDPPNTKRLIAYVVPQEDGDELVSEQLANDLKQRLPQYMVPTAFIVLDALPLTANGKLDRDALPKPRITADGQTAYTEPRTDKEKILAQIWAGILGLEQVGIQDNFFELGGDSILSIQIVAKANEAGLGLSPKDLFQHQTIAQLALVTGTRASVNAEQGPVTGQWPLTPIQHWFFENQPEQAHHFNQAILLKAKQKLDANLLHRAVQHLLIHHDALRARFMQDPDGHWHAQVQPPLQEPNEQAVPAIVVDLAGLEPKAQKQQLENQAQQLQASLDLERGPLVRTALFEMGPDQSQRLLIVVHHLVVDGVSWRLLLEDLQNVYQHLANGREPQLPAKTTSFKYWAERLSEYATSEDLKGEISYWQKLKHIKAPVLPLDHPTPQDNTEAQAKRLSVSLTTQQTKALLGRAPKAYHTRINDLLLTALAQTFQAWAGTNDLLINLEGHGRDPALGGFDDIDLGRTVGWFTSLYPVHLELPAGQDLGQAIKAIKEQLRQVPQDGIGYGVLRYLYSEGTDRKSDHPLAGLPEPKVSFNYLGQFDQGVSESGLFELAGETSGQAHSMQHRRHHLIDVNAAVANGQLGVTWTYNALVHNADTIEQLAHRFMERLEAIVEHCGQPGIGGYTPSDFPLAKLDQATIDRLLKDHRELQDIYPLAPMQEGMLFHHLAAPQDSVFVEQLVFTIDSELNTEALEQAWQKVIDRHDIFRTCFAYEGLDKPVQIVRKRVNLPWTLHDWRGQTQTTQAQRLEQWLDQDHRQGFDLTQAPAVRLNLIQTGDRSYHLIWSFHHILLDGWSLPLVMQEVLGLYEAKIHNGHVDLPTSRPYRDYIEWLSKQDFDSAQAYWVQRLQDFTTPTPLGVDRAGRDGQPGYDDEQIHLTESLSKSLQEFAKQHKLTLNTVVQGAWALLLSRYSGEPDVIYGATVSGRPTTLADVNGIIGLFINTLPMRVRVSSNDLVVPWLNQIQSQQVDNRQYEYTPLAQIQAASGVAQGHALFESIFVFENYPVNRAINEKAESLKMRVDQLREQTNYPLAIIAAPGTRMSLRANYDPVRLLKPVVSRLLESLCVLLEAMVAHPQGTLGALPTLSPEDRARLIASWNTPPTDYPNDLCVHQLFEQQAAATPEAVALVFEGQQETYKQLNEKSNQLAHELQRLGVAPDTLVGICVDRGFDLIVGLLGILKAGGAYVPLDLQYPAERLATMIRDTAAPVLLTQTSLLEKLPNLEALNPTPKVFCLDSERDRIEQQPNHAVENQNNPDHLAYVTYTSGSTGVPKGVQVRHRGVTRLLFGVDYVELGPQHTFLQLAPVSFDASTLEIWGALLHGGRLVLYPERVPSVEKLGQTLHGHQVTTLWLTASLYNTVIDQAPQALAGVRQLLIGGEALSVAHVLKGLEQLPETQIINGYGPTESTTFTCCYRIPKDLDPHIGSIPIGPPIANTQVYILAPHMNPCPPGVPGELYIGGAGLARGYLNDPQLTQRKFVRHLFSDRPYDKLYKTGDRARYLPDGQVEFLGRLDDQVKIRGFRVELGEIESALGQLPGIREAAVLCRQDQPHVKRLVAYVVPQPGDAPDPPVWVEALKGNLPDYMVPAAFVVMDALPLTPNGKLDRKALPEPEDQRADRQDAYVAPTNDTEHTLAEIWSKVLGVERIGIHDNFFELGGDSILSIQIVAKANQAGVHLTPKHLFDHQTIAELAQVAGAATVSVAEQGLVTGSLPLTPVQEWFFEQELAEPNHFNQAVMLEIPSNIEPDVIRQAIGHLIRHHDALRLRFRCEQDNWHQQIIEPDDNVPFACVDLTDHENPIAAIEPEAAKIQTSLDVGCGPLIQTRLWQLGQGQPNRLLIAIHHLAVDGVSWRILLEDVQNVCQQLGQGESVQLPHKTHSFKDWANRLSEVVRTEALQAQLPYWLEQTQDVSPLPIDHQKGANTVDTVGCVSLTLDATDTAALLQEAPKAYHTRVNDLLLTALAQTLGPWTGQDTCCINLEGHGRESTLSGFDDIDITRTVGWFTSIYPLTLKLASDADDATAIKAIKEQLRQVPQNGIGYGILRYLHQDPCPLHGQEEPQLAFNYLGQFDQALDTGSSDFAIAAESAGLANSKRNSRQHLIEINALVTKGQLRVDWVYSQNHHHRSTIEQLADRFKQRLTQLIEHCTTSGTGGYTPSDFPLAKLEQAALDRLTTQSPQIEDLYPLTPTQEGMLFHTRLTPKQGLYFNQIPCPLDNIDVVHLKRAWQLVVQRHAILRTAFVWEGLDRPLQLVLSTVELPWIEHDWRHLSKDDQQHRLAALLASDQAQGFDLSLAPVMRFQVIRLSDRVSTLIWSFHHILLDGWSLPRITKELTVAYEAFASGQTPALTLRLHPYRDYIAWLHQQDTQAAESYWRQTLEGFTEPTMLAIESKTDRRVDNASKYTVRGIQLPAILSNALKMFVQKHRLTPNTLFQGLWGLLLARYSATDDVVFGTTMAGRPADLPGAEAMIGLFINVLPMRVRISEDQTLLDWLHDIQDQQLQMRQYEHSALVDIQSWSQVPPGTQLFRSLLTYENYPVDESFKQVNAAEPTSGPDGKPIFQATNYPLELMIIPGVRFKLQITYDRFRFDAGSIAHLLDQLQTLITGVLENPKLRPNQLPMLGEQERHKMLVEWNQTQEPYELDTPLHQRCEIQAQRTPNVVAVEFGTQQLTYAQLHERANKLAHQLRDLGVGPDCLAAVCMDRSIEMVVSLLAILKAGGAYVPIDPTYPSKRLQDLLDDAQPSVLLTQQHLEEALPKTKVPTIFVDSGWSQIDRFPSYSPKCETGPDNLAYMIYTSGSTGQPKGVMNNHRGICNRLLWMQDTYQLDHDDRILQKTPFAFDVSVWEFFWPLITGARLVVAEPDGHKDSAYLVDLIARRGITTVHFVPPMLHVFLEDPQVKRCTSLRRVICSGETLPFELKEQFFEKLDTQLHNLYGPTEAAVDVTAYQCQPGGDRLTVPIGRPVANTQIYILDRYMQPMPIGVPGHLYIGGIQVARGYLNRPQLTGEKFIADPFSDQGGDRLYQTGDLALYLPNGDIEFLGRIDHQVKIRGFRIELGEIESALTALSQIKQAVVLCRQTSAPGNPETPGSGTDAANTKRLVAYVVPEGDHETPRDQLVHDLKQRLPDYMVPSAFVTMDALPLTPNGKLDRKALPAPEDQWADRQDVYVAPTNDTEQTLADIWSKVLGQKQVGIHDDFFQLGGHSLLATQLISRARVAFSIDIPLRSFFEAPTVAEQAIVVTGLMTEEYDEEELAELIDQIQGLSDEELEDVINNPIESSGEART